MAAEINQETLSDCCLTEFRPLPGTPRGQMVDIAGIKTYHISGESNASRGKAIVLLTDVFGLTKNPCMTADELSQNSGFDVFVPDLFNGDAIPSSFLKDVPEVPGEKMSFGTKISVAGKMLITGGPWMFRHRQAVTLPIVERFFKTLREEKRITRIAAVGYCFGGLYALLAGGSLQLVDAIVGCHVSLANRTHFEQLRVPAAFACAQEDHSMSDEFRREVEEILARKVDTPSKFLMTDGTVHGFASRPNPDNPVIMKAYKQANDLIVEWATTHL